MQITLSNLPKISLNQWYSGKHWSKRKKTKDQYIWLVKSQFKQVLKGSYEVEYLFEFKTRPLDASNCVAMVKLIEDIIFEKDEWNVIQSITIKSRKGNTNKVTINANEIHS